ncbi:hypothetical protein QOZ91_002372 [Clostridium sardiniense]|nr:hypothetical protein [Clostridium sardiniense]
MDKGNFIVYEATLMFIGLSLLEKYYIRPLVDKYINKI